MTIYLLCMVYEGLSTPDGAGCVSNHHPLAIYLALHTFYASVFLPL